MILVWKHESGIGLIEILFTALKDMKFKNIQLLSLQPTPSQMCNNEPIHMLFFIGPIRCVSKKLFFKSSSSKGSNNMCHVPVSCSCLRMWQIAYLHNLDNQHHFYHILKLFSQSPDCQTIFRTCKCNLEQIMQILRLNATCVIHTPTKNKWQKPTWSSSWTSGFNFTYCKYKD